MKKLKGPGAANAKANPFRNALEYRLSISRPVKFPARAIQSCAAWRCSAAATATHVDRLGGQQQQLCRRHLQIAERQERVDRVRAELAALFRRFCPRVGLGLGGAIRALANRLTNYLLARAFLAACHERPYQRWISLAWIVAKLAERSAA